MNILPENPILTLEKIPFPPLGYRGIEASMGFANFGIKTRYHGLNIKKDFRLIKTLIDDASIQTLDIGGFQIGSCELIGATHALYLRGTRGGMIGARWPGQRINGPLEITITHVSIEFIAPKEWAPPKKLACWIKKQKTPPTGYMYPLFSPIKQWTAHERLAILDCIGTEGIDWIKNKTEEQLYVERYHQNVILHTINGTIRNVWAILSMD